MRAAWAILAVWVVVASPLCRAEGLTLFGESPKYQGDFGHFSYADPENAVKGGSIRLHSIGSFDSLNPYILKGVAAASLSDYLDATLMKPSLDEPSSQYGYVAESVAVTADKVTFTIRESARFSDGEPITAEDVAFSFKTILEKGHPFYRLYFLDIDSATAITPDKVVFKLKPGAKRDAPLVIGSGLPVLPKHWWQSRDFARPSLETRPGSGPYRVLEARAGRAVTYERIKNWWGAELAVNRGFYNFDKVIYTYFRDETVALTAFKAGDYDFRLENQAKAWAEEYRFAAAEQGLVVVEELDHEMAAGMQGFAFNTRRPVFKDPRVRKALTLAYDFQWANRVLFHGQYTRSLSFFANSELAADNAPTAAELALLKKHKADLPSEALTRTFSLPKAGSSDKLRSNLRAARRLLADAGWETVKGKLVNKQSGRPMRFEILLRNPHFERVIFPYIKNLERLGVEAVIRSIQEDARYQKRLEEFDFDMIVVVWPVSLAPGSELLDTWSSGAAATQGSRNFSGVASKAVDGLLDEVTSASSRAELLTAVRALDRALQYGYYVVPHWHLGRFRVAWWNKFSRPQIPPLYGLTLDTWWTDKIKLERLERVAEKKQGSNRLQWLAVGAAFFLFYLLRRRRTGGG